MTPRRHDWVYVHADTQPVMDNATDVQREWVAHWIARGGPLVVTRQHAAEGLVSLGAVLPASHGAARIASTVPPSAIARQRGPVTAGEAATVLPDHEAAALARFARSVAGHALQLGIYGSTAWEFFTDQGYRHAHSDLDVVCDVASSAGFTACLAAFAEAAHYFPARIDGELRFASGHAVAWRELHDAYHCGASVVLAKGEREIAMLPLRQILAPLR
ncbi:MAG: malonate decarboxylase holo-[acyl-carrier-protein] synthase [Casimicrobiaceae bacterium]